MWQSFYQKLNLKSFKLLSIAGCFLGDISISYYFISRFADEKIFKDLITTALVLQPELGGFNDNTQLIEEIYHLWTNWLYFSCALLIFVHLCIYFFYFRNKKACSAYIHILSFLGALTTCTLFFQHITSSFLTGGWFFIQTLLYLFTFVGFFSFPWWGEKLKEKQVK